MQVSLWVFVSSTSTCHTKVMCGIPWSSCADCSRGTYYTFCISWLFFIVWRVCLGMTCLGFVIHGACVVHCPHRPVVHLIQKVCHCLWLQCMVCWLMLGAVLGQTVAVMWSAAPPSSLSTLLSVLAAPWALDTLVTGLPELAQSIPPSHCLPASNEVL